MEFNQKRQAFEQDNGRRQSEERNKILTKVQAAVLTPSPRAMATIWCWSATPPLCSQQAGHLRPGYPQVSKSNQLMAFISLSHSWPSNWGPRSMGMGPGKFARSRHWKKPGGEIALLSNKKCRHFLEQSKATAVLITEADLLFCPTNAPVLKGPPRGFAPGCPTVGHHPAAGHGYPSERRHRG